MNNQSVNKLRVVLITQGVSRVVFPVLQQSDVEIVGIVESASRDFESSLAVKYSIHTLASMVKNKIQPTRSLKDLADKKLMPYFLLHKGNSALFADWLRKMEVDLVIIYSMSQLLPPKILAIPHLGVINLHPSLLPAYRGPNPWFWMYYNLEKQGGVTLHYLDAGEDKGDIIYQCIYDIPLGMKSPDMQDIAIGKLGVGTMLEALKNLAQGQDLPRRTQPAQSPTAKARNIKPEEHSDLINWKSWSIDQIWHVMSGTELWLNSIVQPCGVYSGQRWVIQNFERSEQQIDPAKLGKIEKDAVGKYVRCRDGIIRLNVSFSLVGFAKYIYRQLMK